MKYKRRKKFFNFCPVCGGNLVVKKHDHLKRLVCSHCQFVFYQNSKPTVSAFILNRRKELLLVKRGVKPKYGYWDTPGGFLENGEDPIHGLKREIREELETSLKNIRFLGIYVGKYFERYSISTLNILYQAEISRGRLRPMDDIAEIRWFKKSDLPWRKIGFPWARKALREYLRIL